LLNSEVSVLDIDDNFGQTLIRRSGYVIRYKDLKVDISRGIVAVGDKRINLTKTEYRLLCLFLEKSNQLITPADILTEIWGPEFSGDIHLLHVNISRLRKKLKDDDGCKYIETKTGMGYIIYS
jgi:DNA-binding response OmpR family regulator